MRRNILNKLIAVILLASVVGCRTKKEIRTAPAAKTASSAVSKTTVLKEINNKQLDFQTLQFKAKANLSINNRGNEASMNIRMKKDQALWVSVTVIAGIEVARALITPDSVKVINRLESTYLVKPFNYINEFTNEQVNFSTLQALLVGNTVPDFISDKSEIQMQNNKLILSGILKGLAYTVNYNESRKVTQTALNDSGADQSLTASYSDFYVVSDRAIPHSVSIKSTADRKNVDIQLKYLQVGVNESLDFPFSVPKRFTVIN